jgi:hypothetical protein
MSSNSAVAADRVLNNRGLRDWSLFTLTVSSDAISFRVSAGVHRGERSMMHTKSTK